MAVELLELLRRRGWMTPAEIRTALDISQPTLSRQARRAGDGLLRVGAGPRARYAARREVFGSRDRQPVFAVSESGQVEQIATLHAVAPEGFFVETDGSEAWLLGDGGDGIYEDLPWFLEDLRPQGFLGRRIGQWLERNAGWPANPDYWDADTVGRFLLQHGEDVPGNLLLGEAAVERFLRRRPDVVSERGRHYAEMADAVIGGDHAGSSAGGEQPKFAAFAADAGHVLVKFSPRGGGPEARRWQDLLIAEWHALACLRNAGVAAVAAEIHHHDGRIFLEVPRFDRLGEFGRRASVTLTVVDMEFVGTGASWSRIASGLAERGLIDADTRARIEWLDLFGAWIANNDRHPGNISLLPGGSGFQLHPVYDMLPMAYAPIRGEVPVPDYQPPIASRLSGLAQWRDSGSHALAYWDRLREEPRLSEEFREIAAQCHGRVERALL